MKEVTSLSEVDEVFCIMKNVVFWDMAPDLLLFGIK
jgi:hypothetical protein